MSEAQIDPIAAELGASSATLAVVWPDEVINEMTDSPLSYEKAPRPAPDFAQTPIDYRRPVTDSVRVAKTGKPLSRRKARREARISNRRWRWLFYARDFVLGLIVLAIFALGIAMYYLERFEIFTNSMEPTLPVGETFWATRLMNPPERGELVAFTGPWSDQTLIKRVIALPGETIAASNGIILINLGEIDESVWVKNPEETEDFGPVTLSQNEYFLMGDNRDMSTDSRMMGPIDLESIKYRLIGVD